LLLGSVLAACGQSQPPGGGGPPPPAVTVAKPIQRPVTDQDEYVGRFVAIDSVEVRSRVSGYLDQIHFRDGQMVKQGDLLFTIDKRPFQNTLDQARGVLAQAKANLAFTHADLERAKQLVRDKTITEQAFDQRTQAFRGAEASVASNEAAVRQAELDLQFTELRAPVAGRIGDRRVSAGNLVTGGLAGNTSMLAMIVSLDPIRFEFTMDEASYLRYERFSGSGKEVTGRDGGVIVALKLLDEKDFAHGGTMDFVDNVIDRSSGTIRGRAVFSNKDGVLTPGMFGRIRVPGSPTCTALLVPDAAIGTEQIRKFVLVVDAENAAVQKYVTLGPLVEDNLRVIKEGITADDRVVINGLMRVRPGMKVTPQEQGAAPVAAGPQAKNP
jgi:RND family efflux transporter MFP subunit